ncbi:MAG: nitrilase-related carbon-nitrogen hydrolase [Pseudomonadota bacterium]
MKIAVLQDMPAEAGQRAVLQRLDRAARDAALAGADLLVTPEMYLSGYAIGRSAMQRYLADADTTWAVVGEIAKRHGVALAVGGPLASPSGEAWNAVCLYDATGELLCHYAKTHLYGALDREMFAAGDRLAEPVTVAGRRIGLAICYDIEFPETARSLVCSGAEVLIVPTANMEPYASVCTRLVPARAEENATPIAYANYVGREGDLVYCGRSVIVGPDGEDLARGDATTPDLLIAELSAEATTAARRRTPYLTDRRPDLYATLIDGSAPE